METALGDPSAWEPGRSFDEEGVIPGVQTRQAAKAGRQGDHSKLSIHKIIERKRKMWSPGLEKGWAWLLGWLTPSGH